MPLSRSHSPMEDLGTLRQPLPPSQGNLVSSRTGGLVQSWQTGVFCKYLLDFNPSSNPMSPNPNPNLNITRIPATMNMQN